MDNARQPANRAFDYDVLDEKGNKLGSVEDVWVDGATDQLEFVAVKTGTLLAKTHIVPVAGAQIDDGKRQVRVPYSEKQIKDAPHFEGEAELSDDDEQRVYSHYGIRRSTAPSPTGLPGGTGTTGRGEPQQAHRAAGSGMTEEREQRRAGATGESAMRGSGVDSRAGVAGQDQQNLTLSEERLRVGKRDVETGRARVRKVVRTEHVSAPVELRREEVTVERVPAGGREVPADAFQEKEIEVPVKREEPVVEKEAHVTGQVRVAKTAETEQRRVEGDVRREDVAVDREGDANVRGAERDRR